MTDDAITALSKLSGIKPKEINDIWEKVKANIKRLNACPRHETCGENLMNRDPRIEDLVHKDEIGPFFYRADWVRVVHHLSEAELDFYQEFFRVKDDPKPAGLPTFDFKEYANAQERWHVKRAHERKKAGVK